jgi:hypothetical protein
METYNFYCWKLSCKLQSNVTTDDQSASPFWCQTPIWGPKTRFLLLLDSCGFFYVGRPLRREDGSVIYNCSWSSPAQSFSGPSPAGYMTIFHCLRFETPTTWKVRFPYLYPPRTGWLSYTPRHWIPFPSPPATRSAAVEVSEPASTRAKLQLLRDGGLYSYIKFESKSE